MARRARLGACVAVSSGSGKAHHFGVECSAERHKNVLKLQERAIEKSFAELFAGIGLMRLGLESSGWQFRFATILMGTSGRCTAITSDEQANLCPRTSMTSTRMMCIR